MMDLPESLIPALIDAKNVLILTGAGMSAESGVPTFRDAQSGIWEKFRPEDLATPEAFERQPQLVWDWYCDRRTNIRAVRPHAGHDALVEMEKYFSKLRIVTQNVDSLHQMAGSKAVTELHGNIMRSICNRTGKTIDEEWIRSNPGRPPASPHHPQGLARPGVVWFGESLPENAMASAVEFASNCDVCFSIGTSSMVQPAASIPYIVLNKGATVIEINPVPTSLTKEAHFSLQSTAAEALTGIVEALAKS